MRLSSKNKGEIAQLKIQLEAARRNIISSIPTTEVSYDILLDSRNNIKRAQIKYCNGVDNKNKNCLRINLCDYGKTKSKRKYYTSYEIDILLVFVPKLNRILAYNPVFFHKRKRIYINLKDKNSKYYWKKFIW